jgi:hypothetical protein
VKGDPTRAISRRPRQQALLRSEATRLRMEARQLFASISDAVHEVFEFAKDELDEPAPAGIKCFFHILEIRAAVPFEKFGSEAAVSVFESLNSAAVLVRDDILEGCARSGRRDFAWYCIGYARALVDAMESRRQVAQRAGASVSTKRRNTQAARLRLQILENPSATVAELAQAVELDESWIRKIRRQVLADASR